MHLLLLVLRRFSLQKFIQKWYHEMLLPASCTASCGYKSFSALDGLLINKSEAQLSSGNKKLF